MPDPKPPSLVEVLRAKAAEHAKVRALVAASDPAANLDLDRVAAGFESCYLDMAELAAPYAARLAALEVIMHHRDKIAECRKILYDDDASHMAQLIAARFTIDQLLSALAAVPEIKEKDDGS